MKRINKTAGPDGEAALYVQIRELILAARRSVSRGVALVQVWTNFEIGRHIVEYEQKGTSRAAYGKEIRNTLASRLAVEFGPGFSRSNIAYMRSFYMSYQKRAAIVQKSSGQLQGGAGPFSLSWSHYIFLLGVKNPVERSFYEIEATNQNWTLNELKRQFNTSLFDRHVKTKTENATIGIVLCKKKHEALVEITLPKGANIHAKEYQLYLPSKEELQKKLVEWSGEKR